MNSQKRFFAALVLCSGFNLAYAEQTFTFGVVPQQSASKLLKTWGPILKNISVNSGVKITFKTAKNISTFEDELLKGQYDFAYMNPYHYTEFNKKPGYIAFSKAADRKIKGIIVIKKDSPIQNLKDLNQQTIVFPSPNAFAASMLIQGELKAQNIEYTPKYVSSHDSVYLNVSKGLYPAGGGIQRTLSAIPDNLKSQLTVLKETNLYTPHAFAYHPRTDQAVVQKIVKAFTSLHQTPLGKEQLGKLKISSIEPASNENWDDVRSLNLTPNK